jgi:hypothetical protein
MMQASRRSWVSVLVLSCLGGCAATRTSAPAAGGHEHAGANVLQHYHREAGDPEWLVRAGQFHGHLGPWLVLGVMVGQDALQQLETDGYWDIEIVVWLPPERQQQPWSCILDGLQVTSGATLGKQNIRMDWPAEARPGDLPAVLVLRREISRPAGGCLYRLKSETAAELAKLSPERLERLSRELAVRKVGELFDVTPYPAARNAKPGSTPGP